MRLQDHQRIRFLFLWLALTTLVRLSFGQETYTLSYDPNDGNFSLSTPDGLPPLAALRLRSKSVVFTGPTPETLNPNFFDVFKTDQLFKLDTEGFAHVDFGTAITPGLSESLLAEDLCFEGAILHGGSVPSMQFAEGQFLELCDGASMPEVGLNYNTDTGELRLDVLTRFTSFLLGSREPIFLGERPETLDGPFDIFDPLRIFKFDENGFAEIDFGMVLPPGMSIPQLRPLLCGSHVDVRGRQPIAFLNGFPLDSCESPTLPDIPDLEMGAANLDVLYHVVRGDLTIRTEEPLARLDIESIGGLFTGSKPPQLSDEDIFEPNRITKIQQNGFSSFSLTGNLPPRLTFQELNSDLVFTGITLAGGSVQTVNLLVTPEPTTFTMLIGSLSLVLLFRKRAIIQANAPSTTSIRIK